MNMKQIRYETLTKFRNYLERERQKAHQEYLIAMNHLPADVSEKVTDAVWETYRKTIKNLDNMEQELNDACEAVYKNGTPEEQTFWGVNKV